MKVPIKTIRFTSFNLIISILIGLASAFLARKYPESGIKDMHPVLIALLTFISNGLIRLISIAESSNEILEGAKNLQHVTKHDDPFSELLNKYQAKSIRKIIDNRIIVIGEDAFELWRDCLFHTQNSFNVVSYARPELTWNRLGWHKLALAIQRERIVHGCTIERVFLLDKNEDPNFFEQSAREQDEIEIRINKLKKEKFMSSVLIKENIKAIKTCDFAIIDNAWLHRVFLDKDRNIKYADLTKDQDLVKKAKDCFREAKAMSDNWNL